MTYESVQVGDSVMCDVFAGKVKRCLVLDKKPAGTEVWWTASRGAALRLRVEGSRGKLYIVRTPGQCWAAK